MKGSHAPSLRTLVRRLIVEEARVAPGTTVLCACSGGPDSTAMLHVLAGLRDRVALRVRACAVDHGLRPEAAEEIALVEALCRKIDVPFHPAAARVAPGPNLMARARTARYAALRAVGAGCGADLIATAHTADDRAETVVMRLLRGAGPRGLAVLPPLQADLLRPIVRARRSDVLLHLERAHVPWATDPSNLDARFLRARVRRDLMPLLASLSPNVVASLCSLADALAEVLPAEDPLMGLGRRQRESAERALRRGARAARIRVGDLEEVLVRREGGKAVLTELMSPKRRRNAP
jgi:tRNA(Ile)-lysidine synthase